MKKFKKALILSLSLVVFSCFFVGCGNKDNDANNGSASKVDTTQNSNTGTNQDNSITDDIGNGLEDVTNGIVNGAQDVTDGVVGGVEDMTGDNNNANNNINNSNNNSNNKTTETTTESTSGNVTNNR